MKKDNGKVYYFCFYADREVEDKIIVYPSVISKIDYVASRIKMTGKQVNIVSIAPSINGKFKGLNKRIDDFENHIYLKSSHFKSRLLNKFYFLKHNLTILSFLLKNVKKQDTVLVYHSLYNRFWFRLYSLISPNNTILQIEDVFSALSDKNRRFAKTEWKLFKKMKKCICVNDILREELSCVPQTMVSYGNYQLPELYEVKRSNKIRVIYAGVIEQERLAAFLAVRAMKHLPDNYELHILGFGTDSNLAALNNEISSLNDEKGYICAEYHGCMQGEEYYKFLQSCDIALSTHAYDENSMSSADFTFPSKTLVYVSNSLRVVAQRLRVLEKSEISPFFSFYDKPDPKLIANAIKGIDVTADYDSRTAVKELDEEFILALKELLC